MISIQYSNSSFAAKRVPETPVEKVEIFKCFQVLKGQLITEETIESFMCLLMRCFDAEKTPNPPSATAKNILMWLKNKSGKLYIMSSVDYDGKLEEIMDNFQVNFQRAYSFFPGNKVSIVNALYQATPVACCESFSDIDSVCVGCLIEYLPLLKTVYNKSIPASVQLANMIHLQHHIAPITVISSPLNFEIDILHFLLKTWGVANEFRDLGLEPIMALFSTISDKIKAAAAYNRYMFLDKTQATARAAAIRIIRNMITRP